MVYGVVFLDPPSEIHVYETYEIWRTNDNSDNQHKKYFTNKHNLENRKEQRDAKGRGKLMQPSWLTHLQDL